MDKNTTIVALVVIGLVFVAVYPAIGPAMANWRWPWEPTTTTTTTPTTIVTGEQVDLFLMLLHDEDQAAPAATPVNIYDANKEFVGSWSSSSGLVTVTQKMIAGTSMYWQARAAAPGSATYVTYTTPLMPFTVPHGDVNGDAYIQIAPYFLYETSTSAASFTVTDQSGNSVNTEATLYVNDTDTSLSVLVAITTNCDYGTPEDFTDMATGVKYIAGAFLQLKCTATQPFLNGGHYYSHFYSSSLHFYIFRIDMIQYSTNLGYQSGRIFTLDTGTTSFTASADFDFDLFDTCKLNADGQIDENSFVNGDSDLNPTALANKVA